MDARAERVVFIALSTVVFAYVAARTVLVPVVHDEAMAFFRFVETSDFLPFLAPPDAGNHVLATALGWLGWKLFGMHAWALRLPSLLAFPLYAFHVWKWGTHLRHGPVRRCLWAALLLTPFLLDFFSLFRGYGLAMAFWCMAMYHLSTWSVRPGNKGLAITLLATACAGWASLNLLVAWAAVLAFTAACSPWRLLPTKAAIRQAGLWVALGAMPFLAAVATAEWLSRSDCLYYGNTLGVVRGSVASLMPLIAGTDAPAAPLLVLLVLIACTAVAAAAFRTAPRGMHAWVPVLCAGLLWADGLARVVLHHWKGTPFPEDRTVLHWVTPFLLLFAFAVERVAQARQRWQWAALPLLALPVHAVATANLNATMYWPEQAIPAPLYRAANDWKNRTASLPTIGGYHQMIACWGFGQREHGLRLNAVDITQWPLGGGDLLLLDPQRSEVPPGYRLLALAGTERAALYGRTQAETSTLVLDSILPPVHGNAELRELWRPPTDAMKGNAYRIELDLALKPEHEPMTGVIVVETIAAGLPQHRDFMLIQFLRDPGRGIGLQGVRRIPEVPSDAGEVVAYLWNQLHQSYTSEGRLRVYLVRPWKEGHKP